MVSVNNLSVFLGGKDLFDNVSFMIDKKDRIGLVGKNGAGKSTMLKAIMGLLPPSGGTVSSQKGVTIGYLPQEMKHNNGARIIDEVESANSKITTIEQRLDEINHLLQTRTDYESDSYMQLIEELNELNEQFSLQGGFNMRENIEKFLLGLGFNSPDFERKMSEFSGGWKMRVELCKILLEQPDVLLLDEPTNHLDIESIQWLEDFLKNYNGAIILISHDRAFLDFVTNRTIEINAGKIYDYKFSYSKYKVIREEELIVQKAAAKNQEKYIKETEELINKFRAKKNKAAFAQSLIKKLDKLEIVEVDQVDSGGLNFRFQPAPRSGKFAAKFEGLTKEFPDKKILNNADLMINAQDRISLIGKNGVGKTTIIKLLVGDENYQGGELELGHNISVGYFAQDEAEKLNGNKTIFETIDDIAVGDMRTKVRNILGSFLFSGEDQDKKVKVLSGGEKTRLALCKLLLEPHNFLILDEPTNHLDIVSKNVLKDALMKFDGTLLVVSHDRDFLDMLTNRVFEINNEQISVHHEDVSSFLKRKKKESIALFENTGKKKAEVIEEKKEEKEEAKLSYEEQKEQKKLQNKVQKLEREIEKLEEKIKEYDAKMLNLDYSDEEKANQIIEEYKELKNSLSEKEGLWEETVELLS
ncbi:MAG: ABC-F family ATP-binding cassette domain-containing protein [Flavobacteriales bacterium]